MGRDILVVLVAVVGDIIIHQMLEVGEEAHHHHIMVRFVPCVLYTFVGEGMEDGLWIGFDVCLEWFILWGEKSLSSLD